MRVRHQACQDSLRWLISIIRLRVRWFTERWIAADVSCPLMSMVNNRHRMTHQVLSSMLTNSTPSFPGSESYAPARLLSTETIWHEAGELVGIQPSVRLCSNESSRHSPQ